MLAKNSRVGHRYTRRVGTGSINHELVTDCGPKVFELTIVCRSPGDSGFFDRITHAQKVGLAFAGSAIAALCIYSSATTVLSNLISHDQAPSLEEVHSTIVRIARAYTTPIRNEYPVEFCTIGWCSRCRMQQVYLTQIGRNSQATATEVDFAGTPFELLGSHKADISQAISEEIDIGQSGSTGSQNQRAPLTVIRRIVADGKYSDIGGSISLGILSQGEFRLFATAEPSNDGPDGRGATLKFLNHDLFEDIGYVGPCRVGMPGMA